MQFILKLIHYDNQAYRIILKTIHLTLDSVVTIICHFVLANCIY
jgi:hypothetical protein